MDDIDKYQLEMEVQVEKKSSRSSYDQTSQNLEPTTPEQKAPPLYYYHVQKSSNMMPDWERHYVLCVVIGFLLFLSFVLFAGSLAMNYLVAATQFYGMMPHCQTQEMMFDRWFVAICQQCSPGYTTSFSTLGCVPI